VIGGNASISCGVPPFAIAAERNEICGLETSSACGGQMSAGVVADLKRCYHAVYCIPAICAARRARVEQSSPRQRARRQVLLEFFVGGKPGFARSRGERASSNGS
jgi:UDP-N-acetylglucosamine acyltransferase